MGNTTGKGTPSSEPVTTEMIKDIKLQRVTVASDTNDPPTASIGEPFSAGDLWKSQPAVVFVVRRPGCPLCREHALDLSEKQPELAAKGVKLVGVVHEKLGVEEFSTAFFENGEVYFDEEKAFFNALGMRWDSLSSMLKPSVIRNVRRVQARGVKGNTKGEGRLLGGLLVVGPGDAGVDFEHREAIFVVGSHMLRVSWGASEDNWPDSRSLSLRSMGPSTLGHNHGHIYFTGKTVDPNGCSLGSSTFAIIVDLFSDIGATHAPLPAFLGRINYNDGQVFGDHASLDDIMASVSRVAKAST